MPYTVAQAVVTVDRSGTAIAVNVAGLTGTETFPAHLHNAECSAGAGPHYSAFGNGINAITNLPGPTLKKVGHEDRCNQSNDCCSNRIQLYSNDGHFASFRTRMSNLLVPLCFLRRKCRMGMITQQPSLTLLK